jgi:MFS family permease
VHHVREAFKDIIANRNFLLYLAADLDFYVILTVFSFYANYATGFYGVAPAVAAGFFVACIYGGSITVNILLGTMNLLSLKHKFILSKFATLALLFLLVFFPSGPVFFLISFMLGFVRAIRNVVYPPSVKRFASRPDATPYFSMAPVLTLPFAAGYPLLFGKMLDELSWMQQDSYRLLFGISALIILVTLYLSFKIDFGREQR